MLKKHNHDKEEKQRIENIRVSVRMRPLLRHEDQAYWKIDEDENIIYTINYFASQELNDSFGLPNFYSQSFDYSENMNQNKFLNSLFTPQKFSFDRIYSYNSESQMIYKEICQDIVKSLIEGYNGSIFMYGQTTSGKTFTMLGSPNSPGILPCSLNDIFIFVNRVRENNSNIIMNIYSSYIEIYNERINDLLNNSNNLKLIDDKKYGTIVSGAKRVKIKNFEEGIAIKDYGEENRKYRETLINEYSSRSHCIFQIYLEQFHLDEEGEVNKSFFSCLNLVDLAGSERINDNENKKKHLGETGYINKSLFMLTNVINKLAENSSSSNKKVYIPYRDSKLTRLLSQSLGGNSLTTIICTISPATMNFYQTLSTLRFATRAKNVRLQATTNEFLDDKDKLYYYQKEIKKLKDQIRNNNNNKINYNINTNMNFGEESFGGVSQYEYNKIVNAYRNLNEELENYKQLYLKEKKKSEQYRAQITGNNSPNFGTSNFSRGNEEEDDDENMEEDEKEIINSDYNNLSSAVSLYSPNTSEFKSYKNFKLSKRDNLKGNNNGGTKTNFINFKNGKKINQINKNNISTLNNEKDDYESLKKYIRINRDKSYKKNIRMNSYDEFKKKKKNNFINNETNQMQNSYNKVPYFGNRIIGNKKNYKIIKKEKNKNNNYYLTDYEDEQNIPKKNNNIILNENLNYNTSTKALNYNTSRKAINYNNRTLDRSSKRNNIYINNEINNVNYDKNEEIINSIKSGNVFNMLDLNYSKIVFNFNNSNQSEVLKKLYAFKIDALEKTMDYYKTYLDEYYRNKLNEINSINGVNEVVQNKKRILLMNVTEEFKNILNKLRTLYKEKNEELNYKFSIYLKNISSPNNV